MYLKMARGRCHTASIVLSVTTFSGVMISWLRSYGVVDCLAVEQSCRYSASSDRGCIALSISRLAYVDFPYGTQSPLTTKSQRFSDRWRLSYKATAGQTLPQTKQPLGFGWKSSFECYSMSVPSIAVTTDTFYVSHWLLAVPLGVASGYCVSLRRRKRFRSTAFPMSYFQNLWTAVTG